MSEYSVSEDLNRLYILSRGDLPGPGHPPPPNESRRPPTALSTATTNPIDFISVTSSQYGYNTGQRRYPSELRYSASLVLGLGYVHIALSAMSFLFGVLGLAYEINMNYMGTGIWTSFVFLSAGLTGVLASKQWYNDSAITWFLAASAFACLATVFLFVLTIYGMARYINWLNEQRNYPHRFEYIPPGVHVDPTLGVTINILVIAIFEGIWSGVSTFVGYRGMKAPSFTIIHEPLRICPPMDIYNSTSPTKFNPLCVENTPDQEAGDAGTEDPTSMDYRERVTHFLEEAERNNKSNRIYDEPYREDIIEMEVLQEEDEYMVEPYATCSTDSWRVVNTETTPPCDGPPVDNTDAASDVKQERPPEGRAERESEPEDQQINREGLETVAKLDVVLEEEYEQLKVDRKEKSQPPPPTQDNKET